MLYLKVDVTAGERFRRATDPKGAITKASWAFMRAQGAVYLRHAIAESPVGKDWSAMRGGFNLPSHPGLLRKSHVLRVIDPFHAEVVNTQPYSTFVYTGTAPIGLKGVFTGSCLMATPDAATVVPKSYNPKTGAFAFDVHGESGAIDVATGDEIWLFFFVQGG